MLVRKSDGRKMAVATRPCVVSGPAVALACGLLMALGGVVLGVVWPSVFRLIVSTELSITPTSTSFRMWRDTPVPITLDFYFFNWTNPEDLLEEGSRPHLVQMGPYSFKEHHEKVNLTWHPNGTLSFRQIRRWFFDPDNSNGSLSDEVTNLNVVALTAAFVARDWGYLLQKSLSVALATTGQKLAITRTVGELLFDGYSSPLITMGKTFPALANVDIPFDKFGWFYKRNNSADYDGLFTMHTGADDIGKVGVLSRWNGGDRTRFYSGPCGRVNGSAGELWPPERKRSDVVTMFSADLCRSISFDYLDDVKVHDLPAYRYSGGSRLMDNGSLDASNGCFCGGQCVPSGVLNVSTCRYGAPAFVSYPHFFQADPYFLRQVVGMQPRPDKHRFYISLEPETGIPLDVAARFQINLLLQPQPYITLLSQVPRVFFPVLWFEERASVTPELSASLAQLLMLPSAGEVCSMVMLGAGLLVAVVSGVLVRRRCGNSPEDQKATCAELAPLDRTTDAPEFVDNPDIVKE